MSKGEATVSNLTQEQRAVIKRFDALLLDLESELSWLRKQRELGLRR